MAIDKTYRRYAEYTSNLGLKEPGFVLNHAKKLVIPGGGQRAIYDRENYPKITAISRLIGVKDYLKIQTNGTLAHDTEEEEWALWDDRKPVKYASIIPKYLSEFTRLKLDAPKWLGSISKRENNSVIGIADDGAGNAMLIASVHASVLAYFNGRFLADFAGQHIDVYLSGPRGVAVFMPEGATLDNASWFSLVMPRL